MGLGKIILLTTAAPALLIVTCGRTGALRCGRCDNTLWAGAGMAKITPGVEPFTDANGNGIWDPGEPFTDVNGNGKFDPVWIAGFGTGRLAYGVHDDLWVRALILEYNAVRVVLVAVDLIGYMANHVMETKTLIRDRLGFRSEEIIICSTHTHDGPDTIGKWGPTPFSTGLDRPYMAFLREQAASAVADAKSYMVPARVAFGREDVPDGIVRDGGDIGEYGRDPLVVDRTLLAMQVLEAGTGKTIATLINFAAHPEILWAENHLISSDFPHYVRDRVEGALGGMAIYISGALGGMMTPNISAHTFGQAERIGGLLAGEVLTILKDSALSEVQGLGLEYGYAMFPLDNRAVVDFARKFRIMDIPEDRIVYSYDQCRDRYGCTDDEVQPCRELTLDSSGQKVMKGCAPILIQAVTLGHAQMLGVPGELLPELANGLPADFAQYDPIFSRPNKYFPQHDPTDLLSQHASPYAVPVAIRDYMKGPYKFILGLANHEGGYIVPEADFNEQVTIFSDTGDHYEETESEGKSTAPVLVKKALELLSRP